MADLQPSRRSGRWTFLKFFQGEGALWAVLFSAERRLGWDRPSAVGYVLLSSVVALVVILLPLRFPGRRAAQEYEYLAR